MEQCRFYSIELEYRKGILMMTWFFYDFISSFDFEN
jgi:hypothetical protein